MFFVAQKLFKSDCCQKTNQSFQFQFIISCIIPNLEKKTSGKKRLRINKTTKSLTTLGHSCISAVIEESYESTPLYKQVSILLSGTFTFNIKGCDSPALMNKQN